MGIILWIILGFLLFVFLRQLPSHKLYVLTRDLQEAQSYFASLVEEGVLTGTYAEEYRARLDKLQVQTGALENIMRGVWPFSPRDFYHIFDGVTQQCYKLRDEVEVVRNSIWRTGCHEKLRFDTYKMINTKALPTPVNAHPVASSASATASPSYSPQLTLTPHQSGSRAAFSAPPCSFNASFIASVNTPRHS
ncbi:hypothetical protein C8Q78DRAFT_182167 [Trametes maxima]|nr:hypothetical protein C8Q78DRAFT_182167 [Trametes maxima]